MKLVTAVVLAGIAYVDVAMFLLVIAAALGVFAFVVWLQNRDNLRALDALLKDKARKGMAVLDKPGPHGA